MRTTIKIINGELQFPSLGKKEAFWKRAEGKYATIYLETLAGWRKHKFYRGAVLPFVFYSHARSGWKDLIDCHLALKQEFLSDFTLNLKGARERVARSMKDITTDAYDEYLEKIRTWMTDNGYTFPSSEDYLKWLDSAPPEGEEYPELKTLKENYENVLKSQKPWRK